ncbi:hypothetical protein [Microbacterium sp. GXF0217]
MSTPTEALSAAGVGIWLDDLSQLQAQGVEKFIASWSDLQNTVRAALTPALSNGASS